jgi:hypothetical protein
MHERSSELAAVADPDHPDIRRVRYSCMAALRRFMTGSAQWLQVAKVQCKSRVAFSRLDVVDLRRQRHATPNQACLAQIAVALKCKPARFPPYLPVVEPLFL